ncbi:malonate decarboxylase holo-[acyl-carrier-protein] synthase [Rhizobium sp. Root1220]|uniref:malonate decarboxylase holo-[acyl-carrier-protein] synthase n=1 Tax=Rhizobium sp. Root1220 TaxID=1736432 RepID=UPI000700171A|nr:malonate decarboxylase holo-[acyl-carrier-protein] synthase [Rhizobium sp. Root1220]KQV70174.1 phosphoribosyl-dephospho-CoA transferase [Rhizobium sp. Root1220]
MTVHSRHVDRPVRRHDLAFVSPERWHAVIAARGELALDPLVAPWVEKGRPLISRRAMPGETDGVPLGLPLPPATGKRRLSFLMQPDDIIAVAPPPSLISVSRVAPRGWLPTLNALDKLARRYSLEVRVLGSLGWSALTGLDYQTERSDLDLLLHVHGNTDLRRLAADLARFEAKAPMRLDGEFIRYDGAAVNWREFHAGAREVLVKTASGTALLDPSIFIHGEMLS